MTTNSMSKILITFITLTCGCIAKVEREAKPMFETKSLDACLVINVDLSTSFASDFETRAYPLMIKVMTEFFHTQSGSDCKVVLSQMSGHDDVVLFEGTPRELRHRFDGPDELSAFLMAHSDPNRSPIFSGLYETLRYTNGMPDVGADTRLLIVTISDLVESERDDAKRKSAGKSMLGQLEKHRERDGALAFFYVSVAETDRWSEILERAGFLPGQYVIANSLLDNPPLPNWD